MYNRNFLQKFMELKEDIYERRAKEEADCWLDINVLIRSGQYQSYKKGSDLVNLSLDGYSTESIANKLGINEGTVRVHKRNVSNELYMIFGKEFFDLFSSYNKNKEQIDVTVKFAKSRLSGSNYLVDLLPLEVISQVRQHTNGAEDVEFDLYECKSEANFLIKFCKTSLANDIQELNKDKLAYLLKVMESKDITADQRVLFSHLKEGTKL